MRQLLAQAKVHFLSLVPPVPTLQVSKSFLPSTPPMSWRRLVTTGLVALPEPAPK
jgi:hypothetical protein